MTRVTILTRMVPRMTGVARVTRVTGVTRVTN